MTWIWIGVAILLAWPLLVVVLLIVLMIHLRLFYIWFVERGFRAVPYFNIPRGLPRPEVEDVAFPNADGLQLRGCYFKTPTARKGVIVFGIEFGANRWSCESYCDHLVEAGYDVFAYEPRNHGDSGQEPGLEPLHWAMDRDLTDARAALAHLKSRADADARGIGWFGISKGAGAGILAASEDAYIRCAVTDGMFSCLTTMVPFMRHWITIYNKSFFIQGLLPSWYYSILARWGIARVGRQLNVRFIDLAPKLRRLRRPLLMLHGARDAYIRPDMAQRLYECASQPKEFWLIPEAKHNEGIHVAGDEYRRRVREFFDRHLT